MTPDNIILSKTNNIEKEMYKISVALRSQSQEKETTKNRYKKVKYFLIACP